MDISFSPDSYAMSASSMAGNRLGKSLCHSEPYLAQSWALIIYCSGALLLELIKKEPLRRNQPAFS